MTDDFDKGYEAAKNAAKVIIDGLTARIVDMEFEIQRANVVCEDKDWSANKYYDESQARIAALEAALQPFTNWEFTADDLRAARAAMEGKE